MPQPIAESNAATSVLRSAEPLALIDSVWEGQARKLLVQANRNGFLYVLDRTNGKLLLAKPFVHKLTWAKEIDADGRPVKIPNMEPTTSGKVICPGLEGASNWFSTSFNPATGLVCGGYGILQPRVGVSLASGARSPYARLFGGDAGLDPYTRAVSDVYQDLFGEGSFTGKGIYDVDAFEKATHGRFPENTLLSHDLIEGAYPRAGLATDIEVYDDYPTRYLSYARRKHRWIRGDWQLLKWLSRWVPGPDGPAPNRLSAISRMISSASVRGAG